MVLTSKGTGKYLSREYLEEQNRAIEDKTGYSAAELTYLEITGNQGTGQYQEDTYKIDTQPVDPLTPQKDEGVDIRKLPKMGGKE